MNMTHAETCLLQVVPTVRMNESVVAITTRNGSSLYFNLTIDHYVGDIGPRDPWAGHVCLDMMEPQVLTITYGTISYWKLWETTVWVGQDLEMMPVVNGTSADVHAFPHQNTTLPGVNQYTHTVSLESQTACPSDVDDGYYTFQIVAYALVGEARGDTPEDSRGILVEYRISSLG